MSFRYHSEGEAARFAELAMLYLEGCQAFRDVAAETQLHPGDACVANSDAQWLAGRNRQGDSERMSRLWYSYIYAASEHMAGLSVLYATEHVTIAPGPLMRAVVEYCSRVLWLLDPGASSEERLVRVFLEEIASAEEAKKVAGRLSGKDHKSHELRTTRYVKLRETAAEIFGGPVTDEDGRIVIGGQRLTRLHDCCTWALELTMKPNASQDWRGIYDFLSNITHPTLYPVAELWTVDESGAEPKVAVTTTLDDHDRKARIVALLFYKALAQVALYNNWPMTRVDRLADAIAATLPGSLVSDDTLELSDR